MKKFSETFLVIALWSPLFFWGYHVANSDGRISFAQATPFEWFIFGLLGIAPYIVLSQIRFKDDDPD